MTAVSSTEAVAGCEKEALPSPDTHCQRDGGAGRPCWLSKGPIVTFFPRNSAICVPRLGLVYYSPVTSAQCYWETCFKA